MNDLLTHISIIALGGIVTMIFTIFGFMSQNNDRLRYWGYAAVVAAVTLFAEFILIFLI